MSQKSYKYIALKGYSEGIRKRNLNKKEGWNPGRGKEELDAAQAAWRCAASQQIWLVEAGLLLGALLRGLGALLGRGLGGLRLGGILRVHGYGTESEGDSGHQRHQFLHLAVLLWIAII
jgi:hypothetical protein